MGPKNLMARVATWHLCHSGYTKLYSAPKPVPSYMLVVDVPRQQRGHVGVEVGVRIGRVPRAVGEHRGNWGYRVETKGHCGVSGVAVGCCRCTLLPQWHPQRAPGGLLLGAVVHMKPHANGLQPVATRGALAGSPNPQPLFRIQGVLSGSHLRPGRCRQGLHRPGRRQRRTWQRKTRL